MMIVCVACGTLDTLAQAFLPAYMPSLGYKKGYVQLADGSTVAGTFQSIFNTENIKNLTLKDEADTKHKITEDQIDKVFIDFNDMDKLSTSTEAAASIKAFVNTDFKQIFRADHFVWEHAITPKKRENLQLVNPGFNTKLKVYHDPTAQETGQLSIGGVSSNDGIEKSYYLVKQGSEVAMRVEKITKSSSLNFLAIVRK